MLGRSEDKQVESRRSPVRSESPPERAIRGTSPDEFLGRARQYPRPHRRAGGLLFGAPDGPSIASNQVGAHASSLSNFPSTVDLQHLSQRFGKAAPTRPLPKDSCALPHKSAEDMNLDPLAEKVAAKYEVANSDAQKLKEMAALLAKGASDRRITETMGITMTEAHTLANELRKIHGLTSMDNLRKTLKHRMAVEQADDHNFDE